MTIAALYEGTATIGATEHSLPNNAAYAAGSVKTDDGIFQAFLELNNLGGGDSYTLNVYEKVRAASTTRIAFSTTIDGAQAQPVFVIPTLLLLYGWDITLTKTAGTDRSIAWSIRQVA